VNNASFARSNADFASCAFVCVFRKNVSFLKLLLPLLLLLFVFLLRLLCTLFSFRISRYVFTKLLKTFTRHAPRCASENIGANEEEEEEEEEASLSFFSSVKIAESNIDFTDNHALSACIDAKVRCAEVEAMDGIDVIDEFASFSTTSSSCSSSEEEEEEEANGISFYFWGGRFEFSGVFGCLGFLGFRKKNNDFFFAFLIFITTYERVTLRRVRRVRCVRERERLEREREREDGGRAAGAVAGREEHGNFSRFEKENEAGESKRIDERRGAIGIVGRGGFGLGGLSGVGTFCGHSVK